MSDLEKRLEEAELSISYFHGFTKGQADRIKVLEDRIKDLEEKFEKLDDFTERFCG